jgi:small subunit ribosomal protein S16
MVRIRLRRVGARNQPSYRIVAADKGCPRDGRFLETLGQYNPRTEPAFVNVDEARLFHWLGNGAQPSDSVRKILTPLGTWDRWERYKAGEDIETLLAEAKANAIEVDMKTRRDHPAPKRRSKKAAAKKETQPEGEVATAEVEVPAEEASESTQESEVEEIEEEEPTAELDTAQEEEAQPIEAETEEKSSEKAPQEPEAVAEEAGELDSQDTDEEIQEEESKE